MSSERRAHGDTGPVVLGHRFARAVEWATALHADQRRKGTDRPYVAHLLDVAGLVLEDGGRESEAVAALLHDVIEDCGVKPRKIRRRFGRKVAGIVVACTERVDGKLPVGKHRKHRGRSTWRRRKQRSLAQLRAPETPLPVVRVKAADTLSNARAVVADLRAQGPETWARFNAGAVDQLWYYRSVAVAVGHRLPGRLADELRASVREMETLAGWWFEVGDDQPGRA